MLELLKMAMESVMSDNETEFLTVSEVAKQLRIDRKTIIRWITTGYLPGAKFGDRYRIPKKPYEEFLRRRSEEYQPPSEE